MLLQKLDTSSEVEAGREVRGGSLGADEGKLKAGKTDLISIRSDSIKATKRRFVCTSRSWLIHPLLTPLLTISTKRSLCFGSSSQC